MKSIHQKTIQDLEFDTVLGSVAQYCVTELGREKTLSINPFTDQVLLLRELKQTSEYNASFDNGNAFPNHDFDSVLEHLKLLKIEDSYLEAEVFKMILQISYTANTFLLFCRKYKDYYPAIFEKSETVEFTKEIISKIETKIEKNGLVKDDASQKLKEIRLQIKDIKAKINQTFQVVLSEFIALGYLDDIKESVVDDVRVLAVQAMYRKKVKGSILGTSKTGSIVYIEPDKTERLTRELHNLIFEERNEIKKILKELSSALRPYIPLIEKYHYFLTDIDVLYAKAKYAHQIGGVLPKISSERKLYFKEAYHPILLLNNRVKNQQTYPQTVELSDTNRIIVISGPNAGGKSITLKTLGLLQLMLQSGLLIPVHHSSQTFLFDRILTDIGDNQSIENHLSTYSYRLKNMNYFLKKCNDRTLFLIDEFGTGSDPELGGALAEVFLEEFYNKEAFGVITTHYTNLKMLANELEFVTNANMLFDQKSLEPMFKLILGQAGSSFTFEVAQKNGIAYSLINRAKKKIENSKVRFDKTIATLQKERTELEKKTEVLRQEEIKTFEENKKLEETNLKIKTKLESYQELFDANQKLIYLGQKLNSLSEKYFKDKSKKQLFAEVLKIVEIENSKRKKVAPRVKKQQEKQQKELIKEVEVQIEQIRELKQQQKIKQAVVEKPKQNLKVGDRVRMIEGKALGTIDKIENKKAVVNYGMFISWVDLDKLELVK
ncbi:MAG: DNA mismatch repair protein MutS [Bacteroidota bacterium]|nr:DNA mismatch repair protein MutS [Bacteroidota bacterium]